MGKPEESKLKLRNKKMELINLSVLTLLVKLDLEL